jgi:rhomboid protease GluP
LPSDDEQAQAVAFYLLLQQRRPWVTWSLLSLLTATFLLELLWGGSRSSATLIRMGAEVPTRIHAGEWWRLLAPTFLHSGWPHFLMNSFVLFSLGPFLERLFGSARFLVLYVLSGLLGSALGTVFASVSGHSLSVGASGALFGLLAATAVLGFRPRGQLPPRLVAELKKSAIINFALNLVISLRPGIDYLAHLGGALAGLLIVGLGIISPTLWPRPDGRPHARLLPRIAAAMAGLGLLASLLAALAHGRPWLLRQPLQFVRAPLGSPGLRVELPTVLGPARSQLRSDGATDISVGDPQERWLELGLVLQPMPSVGPSREDQLAIFQENATHYRSVELERGAVRISEPQQLDIAGWPALLQTLVLPDGRRLRRIDMVAHRHQIVLELREPRDLPPNLAIDLAALLASLRKEAPLRPALPEEPHG